MVGHDVISSQQDLAGGVIRQGLNRQVLSHIWQIAQGGVQHFVGTLASRLRWGKHAVANEFGHKSGSRAVVELVGIVPLQQRSLIPT